MRLRGRAPGGGHDKRYKTMKYRQVIYGLLILLLSTCSGYTKKDGKVYLRSSNEARLGIAYTEIEAADHETFKVIDHVLNIDLAKDKNHVFKGASILEHADPNSFEHLKGYYWKDKKNVYLLQYGDTDCRIQNADPSSFEVINDYQWAKDKNHVYYDFDKLNDMHPKTFIAIDEDWGKNEHSYYYHNLRIDSLDYSTAEIISSYYIKDRNSVFFRDTLVHDANPATFKADGVGSFGHDDKYMFVWYNNEGLINEEYRRMYVDEK